MDEKIIIKATPKNFRLLPMLLILASVIWIAVTYIFELQDLYWLAWTILGLFVVIAVVLYLKAVELTITDKKVTIVNPIFKGTVELPIDSISAIAKTSIFTEGIAVSTSSGRIACLFIDNREKVYEELNTLINKRQGEQSATTIIKQDISVADELKKYKELLDGGIISQEEFEAKKKQLLGM